MRAVLTLNDGSQVIMPSHLSFDSHMLGPIFGSDLLQSGVTYTKQNSPAVLDFKSAEAKHP